MYSEDSFISLPVLNTTDIHELYTRGINPYGANSIFDFKKCCKKYKKGKRCKKCPDR